MVLLSNDLCGKTIPMKSLHSHIDLRVSRPLIVPGYPENTTAVVGGQAKLICKVHRPASTKVQWLKTEASVQGGPPRLRALTVRADVKCSQSKRSMPCPLH